MDGAGCNDKSTTALICALEHELNRSLMQLTDVEIALNAKPFPRPLQDGLLEQKRALLTRFITEMDAALKRLQAQASSQ